MARPPLDLTDEKALDEFVDQFIAAMFGLDPDKMVYGEEEDFPPPPIAPTSSS